MRETLRGALAALIGAMPAAAADAQQPERVQTPVPPFPYRVEEVRYTSPAGGVELAGTLTLPTGTGPFPAAVLLSVAGPDDRDQSHSGHRPFLVLADHLTRAGFAVLRSDDRGVGASGGRPLEVTVEGLAQDAVAASALLKGRSDIVSEAIGLIGNSEGAAVAALAATRSSDVAYVVMLAGPGLDGADAIRVQQDVLAREAGFTAEERSALRARLDEVFALARSDAPHAERAVALRDLLARTDVRMPPGVTFGASPEMQVRIFLSDWYRSQLDLRPDDVLRRVDVPVLALTGTRDLFLPAEHHLPAIENALAESGSEDYTVRALDGVNHVFQPDARTGAFTEYATLPSSFSPHALRIITEWLTTRYSRHGR